MIKSKGKKDKNINKEIDNIRDSLVEDWFKRHGTYRIGFKLKTGGVLYQDIRDLTA